MRVIHLTPEEPIKFFNLLTPDRVEARYDTIVTVNYIDTPGYCVAVLGTDQDGNETVIVHKV